MKFGSWGLARFVLAWSSRANGRVRSGLDGVREFLEILAHVAQIFEQLVDVVGVHVKRLVQTPGQASHVRKRNSQISNGLADIRTIFADQGIDVIQCFIGLCGSFSPVLKSLLQLV